MALPSFLQSMFTPQTQGPGQMAWRDRDVGEGSGEISQGDIQEMYWKRGPAARGHGQQMTNAVRPQDGMGQTAAQDIQEAITKIAPGTDGGGMDSGLSSMSGLEPGGMSSISEVIQASLPGGGEISVQGGAQPAPFRGIHAEEGPGMFSAGAPIAAPDVVGGVSGVPRPEQPFTPSRGSFIGPGFTPTHPTVGDPGFLGESSPELGGAYKPPHAQLLDFIKPYTASLAPQAGVGQTDPATGVPALIGDDFVSEWWEKVKSSASGGTPVPTPGIQPGQTDPATGVPAIIEENLHWPEWLKNLVNPGRNFRATR